MITDHSSAGFEYLLRDRPLVRIHVPELIALANIHQDYVRLLADVSESTTQVDDTVGAVERALAEPAAKSAMRQVVATDLFHQPGTATARCADALYEAIGHATRRVLYGKHVTDFPHVRRLFDDANTRLVAKKEFTFGK